MAEVGKEIKKILDRFPAGKKELLIPILQAVQSETGCLTGDILEMVGKHVRIPANKVVGVATFYDQFRFRPTGVHHFKVCNGTSCHTFTNSNIVEQLESLLKVKSGSTTRDGKYSLETVPCLGACEQGPVVIIDHRPYRKMTADKLSKIIESFKE